MLANTLIPIPSSRMPDYAALIEPTALNLLLGLFSYMANNRITIKQLLIGSLFQPYSMIYKCVPLQKNNPSLVLGCHRKKRLNININAGIVVHEYTSSITNFNLDS